MSHAAWLRPGSAALVIFAVLAGSLTVTSTSSASGTGPSVAPEVASPEAPAAGSAQSTPPWLNSAAGKVSVFVQTTGESVVSTRRRAINQGISKANQSSRQVDRKNRIKKDGNTVKVALAKLDPTAVVIYDSIYTAPGFAVTADASALRAIADRPDVASIEILPVLTAPQDAAPGSAQDASPNNSISAELVDALDAWTQTNQTGQGVKVAVVDTGVDYTHKDFGGPGTVASYDTAYAAKSTAPPAGSFDSAKYIGGVDLAGSTLTNQPATADPNPIPGPGQNHGTHVAGSLLGYGVNLDGSTFRGNYQTLTSTGLNAMRIGPGMAPKAQLYAVKIFGDVGSSTTLGGLALEHIAEKYLGGGPKIDIVNMSIGSDFGEIDDSFYDTRIKALNDLGVVVVISAGNAGDLTDAGGFPGGAERALTVAASDSNDSVAGYSSRGMHGSYKNRVKPDVIAPGTNIKSAKMASDGDFVESSGTSMSAPITAGVAALLVGARRATWGTTGTEASALRYKAALMSTANGVVRNGSNKTYSLTRTGTGRINAYDAVRTDVWLRSVENPLLVTASFGVMEVSHTTQVTRTIKVTNDGATAHTYSASYVPRTSMDGVSYSVNPTEVTVAPGQSASVIVTLKVDPANLRKTMDPTQSATTVDNRPRQFVADSSGVLKLTPTDSSPVLNLGIYAAPKLASQTVAAAPTFTQASPLAGTVGLSGQGAGASQAAVPDSFRPTTAIFEAAPSPDDNNSTSGNESYFRLAADIDMVGAASSGPNNADPSSGTLYFAVTARGPWPRPVTGPNSASAWVEFTTRFNEKQYRSSVIQKQAPNTSPTDRFIVQTVELPSGSVVDETAILNDAEGNIDSNIFDTNSAVIPVPLRALGYTSTTANSEITYKVTLSRGGLQDSTDGPAIKFDVFKPGIWSGGQGGTPMVFGAAPSVEVHRNTNAQDKKILVVHLHNSNASRYQVLDIARDNITGAGVPQLTGATLVTSSHGSELQVRIADQLTSNCGQWSGSTPATCEIRWLRDGQEIPGASGPQYTVGAADVGSMISTRATARLGLVSASQASAAVTAVLGKPYASVLPSISGVPVVGSLLQANPGVWRELTGSSLTYQWLRDGSAIAGATAASYLVAVADESAKVSVRVSAIRGPLTSSEDSAPVEIINRSTAVTATRITQSQPYGVSKVTWRVALPAGIQASGSRVELVDRGKVVATTAVARGAATAVVRLPRTQAVGVHRLTIRVVPTGLPASSALTAALDTATVSKAEARVTVKIAKKIRAKKKTKIVISVKAQGTVPTGKVAVMVGKKTVKRVALRQGKRTVTIRIASKGSRRISVKYLGSSTVNNAKSTAYKRIVK